jgi:hypothetical protein
MLAELRELQNGGATTDRVEPRAGRMMRVVAMQGKVT